MARTPQSASTHRGQWVCSWWTTWKVLLSFCALLPSHVLCNNREAVALFLTQLNDTKLNENYYNATRVLTHWLKRQQTTCTCRQVVVLVTVAVPTWQRLQLRKDGARVIQVTVPRKTEVAYSPRWQDIMAKLHVFSLTEYRRVLFIDSDFVLLGHVDAAFAWADTYLLHTSDYFLAACPDNPERIHGLRVEMGHITYFNSGLLLLKPNTEAFEFMINRIATNESLKSVVFTDQDVFNVFFGGYNAGSKWNNMTELIKAQWQRLPYRFCRKEVYNEGEHNTDTVAIHVKPWDDGQYEPYVKAYQAGLKAVKLWDEVVALYDTMRVPLRHAHECGHCAGGGRNPFASLMAAEGNH